MQTLTDEDVRKAFERHVSRRFSRRLDRLEWLPDDPYEPTGEHLPCVLHAALYIKKATPRDIDVAADLACAIEEQFEDQYTILSHTVPIAA